MQDDRDVDAGSITAPPPAAVTRGARARAFLFLQGPASPFFGQLGAAFAQAGHAVHRINFHAGDQVVWPLPGGINFRGRGQDWPDFLGAAIMARGVTDIVLFGDCRPRHREAIAVARAMRVTVHVFEEGYLRPHWVTLEQGGVNGHSSLPRDPDWYLTQAALLPAVADPPGIPASFAARARSDLAYNFAYTLGAPAFPFARTHRPWHPMVEYAGWGRRLLRRRVRRARLAAEASSVAKLRDYYVFPLQLDCDYQLRQHAEVGGVAGAIEAVLASFAAHAPDHATLVIKEHPLDNGLHDWRALVRRSASRHGVARRVLFVEDGDLSAMTSDARGMVSVNSTSGTLALAAGVPVTVLGRAIYDIPGLTFQGTLDAFWTDAPPPDAALFEAFRRVLIHRCMLPGGFFSREGCDVLVPAAVARIEAVPAPQARARRTGPASARATGRALNLAQQPS